MLLDCLLETRKGFYSVSALHSASVPLQGFIIKKRRVSSSDNLFIFPLSISYQGNFYPKSKTTWFLNRCLYRIRCEKTASNLVSSLLFSQKNIQSCFFCNLSLPTRQAQAMRKRNFSLYISARQYLLITKTGCSYRVSYFRRS